MDVETWIRNQKGLSECFDAAKGRQLAVELLASAASLAEMADNEQFPRTPETDDLRSKTADIAIQTEVFAEQLRAMSVPVGRMERAVPEALERLDALPPAELPADLVAAVLAGGEVSFGPAGAMAGPDALCFALGALRLHRERQAILIAVDLIDVIAAMDVAFATMTERLGRPGRAGRPPMPNGIRTRDLMELGAFSRLLRFHPFYLRLRRRLLDLVRDDALVVGTTAGDPDGPGGLDVDVAVPTARTALGTPVADYGPLLAGGLIGDLSDAYLGGHRLVCEVVERRPDGLTAVRAVASRLEPTDDGNPFGLDQLNTLGVVWTEWVAPS